MTTESNITNGAACKSRGIVGSKRRKISFWVMISNRYFCFKMCGQARSGLQDGLRELHLLSLPFSSCERNPFGLPGRFNERDAERRQTAEAGRSFVSSSTTTKHHREDHDGRFVTVDFTEGGLFVTVTTPLGVVQYLNPARRWNLDFDSRTVGRDLPRFEIFVFEVGVNTTLEALTRIHVTGKELHAKRFLRGLVQEVLFLNTEPPFNFVGGSRWQVQVEFHTTSFRTIGRSPVHFA